MIRGIAVLAALGAAAGALGGAAATTTAAAAAAATAATSAAAAAAAATSPAISARDLPLLVVPAASLAEVDAAAANVSSASGPIDAAQEAYKTLDPADTADDLTRRGYVAGYEHGLNWATGKVLALTTGVLLFRDAAAAEAFVASQADVYKRFAGEPIPPLGLVASDAAGWTVAGLGRSVTAATVALELDGTRWQAGGIAFRAGRVVASVTMARSDDGDLRRPLEANARVLAARIRAAARGEKLDGPPKLPLKLDYGVETKPAGAPPLDRLAVGAGDLPDGATVRSEGWIATPGIAGFSRRLRPPVKPIGSSYVGELQVTLLRNDDLAGARESFASMADPAFFGALIERTAQLSSVRRLRLKLESRRTFQAGDEAAVITWRLETPIGPARVVLLATRRGKLVEALLATGSTRMLADRDLESLLRVAADRLGSG